MGDEGLSQCAGKCDTTPDCVAYSMIESGQCSMLKTLNVSRWPSAHSIGCHVFLATSCPMLLVPAVVCCQRPAVQCPGLWMHPTLQ
jgi:hypothetical protein